MTEPEYDNPLDVPYEEGYEDDTTGGEVLVRRYKDGRSTVYHGGPAGSQDYNKYGEEC